MPQTTPSDLPNPPGSSMAEYRVRVLHAFKIYYPEVFGGIPYAIEQAMAVRPDLFDHELLVCSTNPNDPANRLEGVERVRSFGTLFSLPIAPLYPLRLWQKMQKADLVVLHAPFPLADLVLGLGMKPNVPLIVYWHSDIVSQKFLARLLRPLLMATLRRAKAILLSDERILHRRELVEEFGEKLVSLPYPVDLDRFVLSEAEKEQVLELKSHYPRLVLSIGRLVKYKGFDVLIEAAKAVDATFLIVGDGIERAALQSTIEATGLQDRVKLVGALGERELVIHLHAADVFAMPSISNAETFGIAQLEAMAAGTPVVNTRLETMVPLLARHDIEGLTVEPGDVEELAKALTQMVGNETVRTAYAQNALKRAQQFSGEAFRSAMARSLREAV